MNVDLIPEIITIHVVKLALFSVEERPSATATNILYTYLLILFIKLFII